MDNKKRKSVSVMLGGVHAFFPREMIRGIIDKTKEDGLNAYCFLRLHTKPFFHSVLGDYNDNAFDYQFNTIHDYCRISGSDGYIIGYGTMGLHLNQDDSWGFARRYNSRPLVVVTEKVDLPNCHNIISDNYQGIYRIVAHLIQVHNCKKILFMRGPERNTDAIERFAGYKDAMRDFGQSVADSMLGIGNFSAYVDKEIERVLDANPDADAFVFSNDEMASACYRVCENRGIRIGVDLKVTGFDGCEFSEKLTPPLTSVLQDAYGIGYKAAGDMARILNGEFVAEERFPVHLLLRESCGCTSNRSQTVDHSRDAFEQMRLEAVRREEELVEYQGKSWFIPMMARELNDCVQNETAFCYQVMEHLKRLKVNAAYLFLLDPSLSYDGKSEWKCPDNLYLASYYRQGKSFAYQPYDRPLVTEENGIAQLTDDGDQHQFMCFLLFSGDRQYGLLACDVPVHELAFFYVVSLQLGLCLQYLEISKLQEMHRRQMVRDIEAMRSQNRELDMLSGYDPLSGLLNLRGLTKSVKALCQNAVAQQGYVLYCDLDHLKQINDYFGHPEGNYMITTCAGVLRGCIRESDILARVGGDEFICLVLSSNPDFPEEFRSRLANKLRTINAESDKPYYLGISVGIQPITLKTYEDFLDATAQADKALYDAKKARRADVRKNPTATE